MIVAVTGGSPAVGGGKGRYVTGSVGAETDCGVAVRPCIGGGAAAPGGTEIDGCSGCSVTPDLVGRVIDLAGWIDGDGEGLGRAGTSLKEGVTVIVAVTGEPPAFRAVNEGMFPLPLAASPILVLLLVHE